MLPQVILLSVYLITVQFFLPDFFSNNYTYKKNAEVYAWSRFNKNSFLDHFNITNWNSVIEIEKNDVNISFKNCLSKLNSLVISHVPMKKLNKQQKNFPRNPGLLQLTKLHLGKEQTF